MKQKITFSQDGTMWSAEPVLTRQPHIAGWKPLQMAAPDPLIIATKKAYRKSPLYGLDKLLAQESRWKRKQTIARNKLEEVRDKINKLAKELATPKGGDK